MHDVCNILIRSCELSSAVRGLMAVRGQLCAWLLAAQPAIIRASLPNPTQASQSQRSTPATIYCPLDPPFMHLLLLALPVCFQAGDSTEQKLGGALINALIFVGVVACMTFVLVLLFKHGVSECNPSVTQ